MCKISMALSLFDIKVPKQFGKEIQKELRNMKLFNKPVRFDGCWLVVTLHKFQSTKALGGVGRGGQNQFIKTNHKMAGRHKVPS